VKLSFAEWHGLERRGAGALIIVDHRYPRVILNRMSSDAYAAQRGSATWA
jgi:hypothetical protein